MIRMHLTKYRLQQGVALVFVLLILVLLSIMAASFSRVIRHDAAFAYQTKLQAQSNAIREAGIAYAQFMLTQPPVEKRWRANGQQHQMTYDGYKVTIVINDEAGMFNLNTIDRALLAHIFNNIQGEVSHLAQHIIDWQGGQQNSPKKRFKQLKELRQIEGMSDPLYQQLTALFTVYGQQKIVDLSVAPDAVLALLPGSDPAWVETLLQARNTKQSVLALPPQMTPYAGFKTQQLGKVINITVWLTQADGGKLGLNLVLQKNAQGAYPPFKELERNMLYD